MSVAVGEFDAVFEVSHQLCVLQASSQRHVDQASCAKCVLGQRQNNKEQHNYAG